MAERDHNPFAPHVEVMEADPVAKPKATTVKKAAAKAEPDDAKE